MVTEYIEKIHRGCNDSLVYSRHKQHDEDKAAEGKEGVILQRLNKRYLQQNTEHMAQRIHMLWRETRNIINNQMQNEEQQVTDDWLWQQCNLYRNANIQM